jgi:hypothetical protein
MQIQTARFVNVSDVFEGFPKLQKIFSEGDNYNFSWGDNNRSMIDPQTLIDALENADGIGYEQEEGEEVDPDTVTPDTVTSTEWDKFCARLNALPDDVYIDLEN